MSTFETKHTHASAANLLHIKIGNLDRNDSFEKCQTIRGKTHKKFFGGPKLGFFLDITQDCSLGQCLTSSRAETCKTICGSN